MERNEYLKRPLIEGVEYKISDKMIKIECSHTCFIDIERPVEKVSLLEVERLFRELKKAAKDTGKIQLKGVSKFLPAVRALYPVYCAANEKMSANFTEIAEIARRLQSEGIHNGYCDDELLNVAFGKQSEIGRLHYRNSDYSQFRDYYSTVQRAVQNKSWEDDNIASYTIPLA